jgi:predicted transcriptional regulator
MAREHMKDDVAATLEKEVAAIEADGDPPDYESATISRGNGRSKVLQIRLNPEELAELERLAAQRGLPTSTVAREAIIRLIRPEVARTESEKRLIDAFARYVATLGAGESSPPE